MRFLVLLCVVACSNAWGAELLLFGGRDHGKFLGCLNCSEYDSGSLCNRYGDQGSKFQANSIWNQFGDFGSKFSDKSPWNQFGGNPPAIVDRDGNFYGYLTDNYGELKRTTNTSLIRLIERAREDVDDASDWFCGRGDYE